ncbi:putative uncharacterized protein DDB_G0271606 [Maniola hyperantus]|uniref:putative uncharacterized protein DDB_G0271606 n=1 Tax=Aphantopus hyperantus TaxID=2795564 RepID=UPI002133D67F
MEAKSIAAEVLRTVESMVDPKAPVEQQLEQMRAQMAALAELPTVINQQLESLNKQLSQISMLESSKETTRREVQVQEQRRVEIKKQIKETQQAHQYYQQQFQKYQQKFEQKQHQQQFQQQQKQYKFQQKQNQYKFQQKQNQQQFQQDQNQNDRVDEKHSVEITELEPDEEVLSNVQIRVTKPSLTGEELDAVQREELRRSLEDLRMRKSVSPAKDQASQTTKKDLRAARGKPEPAFGPGPVERPVYLPGGRRWQMSEYDEDQITETLVGQAEVIKGRAMGVNFKKFEKPPPGVDHLKHSEVYRAVHNLEDEPLKKVQMFRPTAFAESEIREGLRSMSPANPTEAR